MNLTVPLHFGGCLGDNITIASVKVCAVYDVICQKLNVRNGLIIRKLQVLGSS